LPDEDEAPTPDEGVSPFEELPTFEEAPIEQVEALTPMPTPPAAPADVWRNRGRAGVSVWVNETALANFPNRAQAEQDIDDIRESLIEAPEVTLDDLLEDVEYQYLKLEGVVRSAPPAGAGLEESAAQAVRRANGIFGVSIVNEGPAIKVFLFDKPSTWRLAPFIAQLAPVAVLADTQEEAQAIRALFEASGIPKVRYAVDYLGRHRGGPEAAKEALAGHFVQQLPAGMPKAVLQPVPVAASTEELSRFFEGHGVVLYNIEGITTDLEQVQTYLERLA
jgi:hypothetical protein